MNARRRLDLRLSLGAEADLYEAERHYSSVSEDTPARFRQALRETFQIIEQDPRMARRGPRRTYRYRVRGFPYFVCYSVRPREGLIPVWAIAHEKRRQSYWTHRVS